MRGRRPGQRVHGAAVQVGAQQGPACTSGSTAGLLLPSTAQRAVGCSNAGRLVPSMAQRAAHCSNEADWRPAWRSANHQAGQQLARCELPGPHRGERAAVRPAQAETARRMLRGGEEGTAGAAQGGGGGAARWPPVHTAAVRAGDLRQSRASRCAGASGSRSAWERQERQLPTPAPCSNCAMPTNSAHPPTHPPTHAPT